MNIKSLSIAALLLMATVVAEASVGIRKLHDDWRFRQGSSELWHPAVVPGNVHLDLMNNSIIDDPFYRLNERSVQWIDKEDWMYETYFTPTSEELAADCQEIVFYGLDTYADVYLNSHRLVETDNMHRTYRLPVKGIMQEGSNHLEVYFHSPVKRNVPLFDATPYRHNTGPDHSSIGGLFDKTISIFARTAGYEYGWDWGPRMVTYGIWRPVELQVWNEARIESVWHKQKDVTAKRALLTSYVNVIAERDMPRATITVEADGKRMATTTQALQKGANMVALPFSMTKPRLWWTNGLGEAYLYEFHVELTEDGNVVDTNDDLIGIRSLRLHNDKDEYGHNLYFELNGEPLYAKGSNMVPLDNFPARVTDSLYRQTVADAKAVNMNIIRVWGGGMYENDAFYRACDEQGILVWQDFMFACGTWPADSAFLATVRQEATDNVKRLRNHPCIAVFAGNNESQDVWYGWGGKKRQLDEMGYGDEVWKMQHDLFYKTLPEVVSEYADNIAYRPSCPWAFEDTPSDGVNGDDHYWGVWHGGDPFDAYFDHHVRFESEYGFQSFPEYESILQYAPKDIDHNIYSEAMMTHQKAGTYANHRIEEYMRRDYPVPDDFKKFIYVGMLLQGDGVKIGMEAFRRDRPYCMGGMVWQLNDCWPVASWSSRDYYGRWKALHYFTRQAYDDILISPRVMDPDAVKPDYNRQVAALPGASTSTTRQIEETKATRQVLEIKLVSDRLKAASGTFTLSTLTLSGEKVYEETSSLKMPANTAILVMTRDVEKILGGRKAEDVVFVMTYTTNGKTYRNIAYAAKQKEMHYSAPQISRTITPADDGFDVTLKTDIFARGVFLGLKGIKDFFTDNYFDLLPGEERTIRLRTTKSLQQVNRELEITTLGDLY